MPREPLKPCNHPGCNALVRGGSRCEKHRKRDSAAPKPSGHNRRLGRRWKEHIRPCVLVRDNYTCQDCGRLVGIKKGDAHVDHIIPTSEGGSDELDNLRTLCQSCHNRKTSTQDGGLGRRGGG